MRARSHSWMVAWFLLALCVNAASAQAVKLRYGVIAASARNVSSLPFYIAQEKGFLAREGIELEAVPLPGVEHMIIELDKGNVDLSTTVTPYLINAALKGSDAVAVVGGLANAVYSLIARPGINSFEDLRGKTIGMSLPVDPISISTRLLLEKHGLADADYKSKVLIGTPLRANCLSKVECDASPLGQPEDFKFISAGFRKLGDSLEVIPDSQFSVIAARRGWALENRDKVVGVARAFASAYRFMGDRANRDEVVAIMTRRIETPPEIARAMLTLYYDPDRGIMPRQAEINMAGLARIIVMLGQTGVLSAPLPAPERFVDLRYLQAAGLQ